MRLTLFSLVTLIASAEAADPPLLPTKTGTTWRYEMTQETGEGYGLADSPEQDRGRLNTIVIYRLDGAEKVNGRDFLKFEMHREGDVTNTDFITVDSLGMSCWARLGPDGARTEVKPPQIMITSSLKPGETWEFDGKAGETAVRQHYRVVGVESIEVPAGKFRAVHVHAEQFAPGPMSIDRWFVKGTGIVKDVTVTRSADNELIRRITLELTEPPQIRARPEVKTAKKLTVGLSPEAVGDFTNTFSTESPKICARWQGNGLRIRAKIKAVWVAENLGEDLPKEYTIDEAVATANAPAARGVFTLGRPEDGWTPGDYRVEFYVDDAFVNAERLRIVKPSAFP